MTTKLNINHHPIWKNVRTYKKPIHLLRISLARQIAKLYAKSMFIGITGSVGKTSTTLACFCVLSEKFNTISTINNLDSIFNIPLTILRITPKVKKVILEMGIEYPGEMEYYLSIIKPATGIVTRVYFAHSEFLGSVEKIVEEKGQLIKSLPKDGFAILNWDDINVRKMAETTEAKVVFFGTDSGKCDIWADKIKIENYQTTFQLNHGVERVEINLPLLGKHWVTSALAAATLGVCNGMNLMNIKKGLEKLKPAEHRLQLLEGLEDWMVLDDTYNSSPIAVEEALNVLSQLPARRRIAVLGEMRELGEFSEKLHRSIAQKIYKDKLDLVLLSGGDTKFIQDELIKLGFPEDKLLGNLTNSQIVSTILKMAKVGDVVLVKGSRAVRLDEVVLRIAKKK